MEKKILNSKFVIFELENEILFANIKSKLKIDKNIAIEIVKTRMGFTEGKSYPQLIQDMGVISIDREAREYFSSEGIMGITAGAFLLNSVFSKFLGNFYLKITRPPIPTKIFTDKAKALEWLGKFKSQQ